jgi:plastocyanin
MKTWSLLLIGVLANSGCGSSSDAADVGSADVAAVPVDASASAADTGSQPGLDASQAAADVGTAAGPDATAVAGPDASQGNQCAASFAGCNTYTDATAAGADRTISFTCCQYTPKCLKIASGQSVTFAGSFGSHPLHQACGPASEITSTSAGNSATFMLDVPGEYGFYCSVHGNPTGSGMAGSIQVVP